MIQDLQRSNEELVRAYDGVIEGWSRALAARLQEAPERSKRLVDMALRLARLAGVEQAHLTHFWRGAMLHDIGNMGLPDSILLKPGKLSEQEWQVVRTHPRQAYDLLHAIPDLRAALDIPFCHHERWDGAGYPRGLKGNEIPVAAQIFSVLDVYDALTSDRPYRKAWLPDQAADHIRAESGKSFSPAIVETFLQNLPSVVSGGR